MSVLEIMALATGSAIGLAMIPGAILSAAFAAWALETGENLTIVKLISEY